MARRSYATLSLLAQSPETIDNVREAMPVDPTRTSSKNGRSGLHYSTLDRLHSTSIALHLEMLFDELHNAPDLLKKAGIATDSELEVRLWLFFEADQENEDFVLSPKLLSWLVAMDGDVCVDVWTGKHE